jgi:hypothetical protein
VRRLVLAIAVTLAVTRHLMAAIVCVQPTAGLPIAATQCAGAVTGCAYVMPSLPTSGNAVICAVSHSALATVSSYTDTDGTSFWQSTTAQAGAGGSKIQIWYTAAVDAFSAGWAATAHQGSTGSMTNFCAEYSGIDTTTAVDKQVGGSGTSTTPAVASTTATNANALYVAAIVHDGGGTITIAGGGTFTERAEAENTANQVQGFEDLISSSAQTGPFTIGSSTTWGDKMVIFNPLGAGGASTPQRTLLGVGSGGAR